MHLHVAIGKDMFLQGTAVLDPLKDNSMIANCIIFDTSYFIEVIQLSFAKEYDV